MKVTWVVQTNMGNESDIYKYVKGIKESGATVIEIEYIPFSDELPQLQIDGPVIFYGTVGFINKVSESEQWPLAVFADKDTFTYELWAKNYGDMLLNSPDGVEMMQLGEFNLDGRDPEDYIFVRPQHDTKSLVGSVMKNKDFYNWANRVKGGGYENLSESTPIIIGTPYGIEAEWRLFIIDHKVVQASKYYERGKLKKVIGAPQKVIDFANKAIKRWSPVRAYVLDVCISADNCYIVEAQSFNSAGTYACDTKELAEAVNKVALNMWNQKLMD